MVKVRALIYMYRVRPLSNALPVKSQRKTKRKEKIMLVHNSDGYEGENGTTITASPIVLRKNCRTPLVGGILDSPTLARVERAMLRHGDETSPSGMASSRSTYTQSLLSTTSSFSTTLGGGSSVEATSSAPAIKRGLLWQQRDSRFFNRWKERYFTLTRDYLYCFRRATGGRLTTEMGPFLFKVKLCDVDCVQWENRKSYSIVVLRLTANVTAYDHTNDSRRNSSSTSKLSLRQAEGLEDWFELLEECTIGSKQRRRAQQLQQRQRFSSNIPPSVAITDEDLHAANYCCNHRNGYQLMNGDGGHHHHHHHHHREDWLVSNRQKIPMERSTNHHNHHQSLLYSPNNNFSGYNNNNHSNNNPAAGNNSVLLFPSEKRRELASSVVMQRKKTPKSDEDEDYWRTSHTQFDNRLSLLTDIDLNGYDSDAIYNNCGNNNAIGKPTNELLFRRNGSCRCSASASVKLAENHRNFPSISQPAVHSTSVSNSNNKSSPSSTSSVSASIRSTNKSLLTNANNDSHHHHHSHHLMDAQNTIINSNGRPSTTMMMMMMNSAAQMENAQTSAAPNPINSCQMIRFSERSFSDFHRMDKKLWRAPVNA